MEKSPLLEEPKPIETLDLTDEEALYLNRIKERLVRARNVRDKAHDEFDGQSYVHRCEQNRRLMNSAINPKKNKEDTAFTTGTARQKAMALLAAVNNLNLEPDVTAYDNENFIMSELGEAIEGIMQKTGELENDDDKRMRRQYTLLEQGEVFIEEVWVEPTRIEKDLPKTMGKFKGQTFKKRLKKALGKPERNILRNENVYLGDITVFDTPRQPYIFTVKTESYAYAEQLFSSWENWKYVAKNVKSFSDFNANPSTSYSNNWCLSDLERDHVEIVKYQDKFANEFQIFINGTPMLPIGFPLPWKHGEYNIEKQVLEPIDEYFAYGKSLMQRLKISQTLEDEFWKMGLLKTQQSFIPPMANLTGKVLSSRIMMPGKMNYGVNPDLIKPMIDARGMNNAEFAILSALSGLSDKNSVNPVSAGQQPQGNPTATQILAVQTEAKRMLGLIVFACSEMEKKIAYLRLWTILEKWFDPVDQKVDEARKGLQDIYRRIAIPAPIEGRGMGQKVIEVTNNEQLQAQGMQTSEDVLRQNFKMEVEQGIPTQMIYLNKDELQLSKYFWQITVIPQDKKTSALQKLMFGEMLQAFSFSPNMSLQWAEEEAARVWGVNPARVFKSQPSQNGAPPPPQTSGELEAAKQAQGQNGNAKGKSAVERPTLGQLAMSETMV